jgi:adenylate cyclase
MAGDDKPNRRLAAILVADVVGYSRMMGADEAGTLAALKHHRETVFDPAVVRHRGRVVKLIGDGTIVEFGSVVDAVNCALAIQRAIKAEVKSDNDGIVLRIGVNLGDVIIDGNDIYGDGVNVAARLEPLADPGGICVSTIVHESVGNRIEAVFSDGGEAAVKNISRPIRIWKWHPDGDSRSTQGGQQAAATASPETEGPSIAVLPFANISGDPEQEYFSDGITEDIITDLSKIAGLLVIARNSSFAYKGKNPDIRAVGRELGVRSVLEGSIRRVGKRVRITTQLINAANGANLWAERYDRDLTDIFAVQDEVTRHIVDALKVKLTLSEAAKFADVPTDSVEAHDLVLRGREFLFGSNKNRETFERAVRCLIRALQLDPNYAQAHALLAWAHQFDYQKHWSGDPGNALLQSGQHADLAISKDPKDAFAHAIAALVAIWQRNLDRTASEANLALSLNPNLALAYSTLGAVHIYSGRPLEAIPIIEHVMRLDPAYYQQYLHFLGMAHLTAGHYETAVALLKQRVFLVPQTDFSRALLASALGHLGELDEARRIWGELKEINPRYSFAEHIGRQPFRSQEDVKRIADGLAKARLPD